MTRNVWQHVDGGRPAARAWRLIDHEEDFRAAQQPVGELALAIGGPKERLFRIALFQLGSFNLGVHILLGIVMNRHFVPFAALLVKAEP